MIEAGDESSEVYCRVYDRSGPGEGVRSGVVTREQIQRARAACQYLRDVADERWSGGIWCRLDSVFTGPEERLVRPLVLTATSSGAGIRSPGQDGWEDIDVFRGCRGGRGVFSRMLVYYALDEYSRITRADVEASVHPRDRADWRRVLRVAEAREETAVEMAART